MGLIDILFAEDMASGRTSDAETWLNWRDACELYYGDEVSLEKAADAWDDLVWLGQYRFVKAPTVLADMVLTVLGFCVKAYARYCHMLPDVTRRTRVVLLTCDEVLDSFDFDEDHLEILAQIRQSVVNLMSM
jgi:hypothetical protein